MDIARMMNILSRHPDTSLLYKEGFIWVTHSSDGYVVIGNSSGALFTALSALTESEPLCAWFKATENEWRAIITDPPTHVSVSAGRVEGGHVIGAVITNLSPNQGVQGIFNTPIHFGKK